MYCWLIFQLILLSDIKFTQTFDSLMASNVTDVARVRVSFKWIYIYLNWYDFNFNTKIYQLVNLEQNDCCSDIVRKCCQIFW